MRKTIQADFDGDKIKFDFEGFANRDCSKEEKAIRAMLARIGVKTNGAEERFKDDGITVPNGPTFVKN